VSSLRQRTIAYAETALCALTGILTITTIFWRDWIEALLGWELDYRNGSIELLIVVVLAITSVHMGSTARRSWQRITLVTLATAPRK